MAWAVDTVDSLASIDWSAFHSWKQAWPQWAGRYFGGGINWYSGEFTAAKAATNGNLVRIAPLQGGLSRREETGGNLGHGYGVTDATDTCESIIRAIKAKQLTLPSNSAPVIVWLDVEPSVKIAAAYWAGWANTVFHYAYNGALPFLPGVYTQFTRSSSGLWYPQSSVQNCLNTVCEFWPDDAYTCYGLWTAQPEDCRYASDPTAIPDWSVFGSFTQTGCGNKVPVPLYLYQYMEPGSALKICGVKGFAGGQNLDLDSSDNRGGQSYMLSIV